MCFQQVAHTVLWFNIYIFFIPEGIFQQEQPLYSTPLLSPQNMFVCLHVHSTVHVVGQLRYVVHLHREHWKRFVSAIFH